MGIQKQRRISRRSFLQGSTTTGLGVLATGVLAGSTSALLGWGERDANALTIERDEHKPRRRHDHIEKQALEVLDTTGVVTRLGILSDAHICDYDSTALDKLTHALETLAWAAPGMDALYMLGDVTVGGYESELEVFATEVSASLLAHYSPAPIMHLTMGNHDWLNSTQSGFEDFFAQHAQAACFSAKQNVVKRVEGATIIMLNGDGRRCDTEDMMNYTVCYDFLAEALAEAASRPDDAVLVFAHEPPQNMNLPEEYECGYYGQGTAKDLVQLIAQNPKARMFSGHIHNPLGLPESINTDLGFTSVHTSTVGSCMFVRGTLVDEEAAGSEGLVLDIRETGELALHRIDFTDQEHFGNAVLL